MPPSNNSDSAESPVSVPPPKRPSIQRRDSFVRSPRFSSGRRLTSSGQLSAQRSPSLLALDPEGEKTDGLPGNGGGALGAERRLSSRGMTVSPSLFGASALGIGMQGGSRDYRATYQSLLNRVGSDTKDLEWDLLEHKSRMIEPIPKERKAKQSFLVYEHLRPIPRSVCDDPEGARLDIVVGPPKVWTVGHAITPTVKVQLMSAEDQTIAAWKANIEVNAVLLNGVDDWLLERADGRSIVLGNLTALEGWEAEFPELRVMDTSRHYKRAQFRLLFVVTNYRIAPVLSEPFEIVPEASPKSEKYLYEAEEEEEVEFAVPADRSADAKAGPEASPLHVAASMGQTELCKLLVAKGDDLNQLAQHGITPMHLLAYLGHDELIKVFVNFGAELNTTADDGMTALHFALVGGRYETAKLLLKQPDLDPRAITQRGWSPMHIAARTRNPDIIEDLAAIGGDVDLRNRDGQTPLHIAAFHGSVPIMRALVRFGANPMLKAKGGWTLAHQAVLGGNLDVLEYLFELNCPIDEQLEMCNFTPLHIACLMAVPKFVTFLFDKGASPRAVSATGWTPTHFAACSGDKETLDVVLKAGSPLFTIDDNGSGHGPPASALEIALEYGQVELFEVLTPLTPDEVKCGITVDRSFSKVMIPAISDPPVPGDPREPTLESHPVHHGHGGGHGGAHEKELGWKRGDGGSYPTFVAMLREGTLPEKREVLVSLVEDGQDTEHDARHLLSYGCDQPLRDIIRRNAVAPMVLDKTMQMMERLASHEKNVGQVFTPKTIPDLLNIVELGVFAARLVESKIKGNESATAAFAAAGGAEKIAKMRGGFSSMSEDELIALAKDRDLAMKAHQSQALALQKDEPSAASENQQRRQPQPPQQQQQQQQQQQGSGPSSMQRHESSGSGIGSSSSAFSTPRKDDGNNNNSNNSSSNNSNSQHDNNNRSNATTTDASNASNNNHDDGNNDQGQDGTPKRPPRRRKPKANAPNGEPHGARKVVDRLAEYLQEQSKAAILILGRGGIGRTTLLDEAAGTGLPGRVRDRMTTNEGQFAVCQVAMAGSKQVTLYRADPLDPSQESSSDTWRAALQLVVDSNSQGAHKHASSPPVLCAWYCVDPEGTDLSKRETEWIAALAEIIPVICVITRANNSRSATAECKRRLTSMTPPIPYFEPVVAVHAKAIAAAEEPMGLRELSKVTADAISDGQRMLSKIDTLRAAITSSQVGEGQELRTASASSFIVPALNMVDGLVGKSSVALAHLGPTLEIAGMSALTGITYVLGAPYNKDGVADVWRAVFGAEQRANKDLLRKLAGGISAQGWDKSTLPAQVCVTLLAALATTYAEVLMELTLDGSLGAATPAIVAQMVVPEMEALCAKGQGAVDVALKKLIT